MQVKLFDAKSGAYRVVFKAIPAEQIQNVRETWPYTYCLTAGLVWIVTLSLEEYRSLRLEGFPFNYDRETCTYTGDLAQWLMNNL